MDKTCPKFDPFPEIGEVTFEDIPQPKFPCNTLEPETAIRLQGSLIDLARDISGMQASNFSVRDIVALLQFPARPCSDVNERSWGFYYNCMGCDLKLYYEMKSSSCSTPWNKTELARVENCFKLAKALGNSQSLSRLIMKYNQQPPVLYQSAMERHEDFKHMQSFQEESDDWRSEYFDRVYDTRGGTKTFNPRIFSCAIGYDDGKPINDLDAGDCNLFHRSVTNFGVGYSFNALPFKSIMKQNKGNNIMNKLVDAQEYQDVYYMDQNARGDSLKMILQLSERLPYEKLANEWYQSDQSDTFRLHIHDPKSLPDLRQSYISLPAGFHYTIKVSAEISSSNQEIADSLFPEERYCRFAEESEKSVMFERYDKTNCIFECQMKKAYDKCGCVPWNYPPFQKPNKDGSDSLTPVCDTFGNACFDKFLTEQVGKSIAHCECLPNCNGISYSYTMKKEKLNVDNYCFYCGASFFGGIQTFLHSLLSFFRQVQAAEVWLQKVQQLG